jgi:vitamin-K-epoxide reductase (warfarin-sensitive)
MVISILIVCLVGLGLSLYGFLVEQRLKENPNYKAVCDLSDRMSCTKPFKSPYGKILKFSNSTLGIIFYSVMIALNALNLHMLLFYGALSACAVSVVLAYVLYTKIQSFCLICTSIYVVNGILLYLTYITR